MRKYAMKILEILHGGMLLAAIYCIVMQQVTDDIRMLLRGLYLLIPCAVLSVAAARVRKFWQFFLAAILVGAGGYLAGGTTAGRIWICFLVVVAAFSFFEARARRTVCWLSQPAYPWLLLFLAVYFLGMYFESSFLRYYAVFNAGCYFIFCNFHTNLTEMELFIQTHASLERLPVKKLGRTNQMMMWFLSGFTILIMFLSPFVGMEHVLTAAGRAFRDVLQWLLNLIPHGNSENMVMQQAAQQQMMMPGTAEEVPRWLQIIYQILDILGFIILICMILGVVFLFLRKLYQIYCQFYREPEENGDKIERLIAPPVGENRKRSGERRKERLFWDFSWEARIRKHYKKQIWRAYQDRRIPPEQTPRELEDELDMDGQSRELLHRRYEKARYGKEPCTREEMQEVLKIRNGDTKRDS